MNMRTLSLISDDFYSGTAKLKNKIEWNWLTHVELEKEVVMGFAKAFCTTHFTASFPGQPGYSGTRKVIPFWILTKQEMMGGSDVSWTICKSFALRSRQTTTQHVFTYFFTGRMLFLRPNQQCQSTEAFYNLYVKLLLCLAV